jgi:hypothetical protein
MAPGTPTDDVLRAKYLDWCSARLAERFLELTPDQIYELARSAEGGRGSAGVSASGDPQLAKAMEAAAGAVLGDERDPLSFRTLVERVTEVLRKEMRLPGFEAWTALYRASPAKYEEELLGLWRERTREGDPEEE